MASLKPKPYAQNNSPSTTSLLTPLSRGPGPHGVQAALMQSPRSASASEQSLLVCPGKSFDALGSNT